MQETSHAINVTRLCTDKKVHVQIDVTGSGFRTDKKVHVQIDVTGLGFRTD